MALRQTFNINGTEHSARPTFDIVARLERSLQHYKSVQALLRAIQTNDLGMADTADVLRIILGAERSGGPSDVDIHRALLENLLERQAEVGLFLIEYLQPSGTKEDPMSPSRGTTD